MRRGGLGDARVAHRLPNRALDRLLLDVVPPNHPRTRIDRAVPGRKDVLPPPVARSVWILAVERIWQVDLAESLLHVLLVQHPNLSQVGLQRLDQHRGQHRHPILEALAFPNKDFAAGEFHILHPQPQRFHDSQARPVQQARNKPVGPAQSRQDRLRFRLGEHDGKPFWSLGLLDVLQPRQILLQYLAV